MTAPAGRVLAYQRAPAPTCDTCGTPIDGDPHTPHDPHCPSGDCQCDNQVHPECCWTCQSGGVA